MKRRVELAAEDVVVAYEESEGRECERVGHQKIGFDVRSLAYYKITLFLFSLYM